MYGFLILDLSLGEPLVVKTLSFHQVVHVDLPTQCECREQEDQQDHRFQDVSHRGKSDRKCGE